MLVFFHNFHATYIAAKMTRVMYEITKLVTFQLPYKNTVYPLKMITRVVIYESKTGLLAGHNAQGWEVATYNDAEIRKVGLELHNHGRKRVIC